MAEESLSPVIAVKPVSIILQVVEGSLSVEDRDRAVQGLWDRLIQLEITPTANMTPLVDSRHSDHHAGLQVLLREPERVSTLVQGVSDRLAEAPVEIRLLIALGQIQVQIQTKYAERLLGLLPALDTLLPARQLFQARAETYALRGGELSPVEQANLELLRHRLNLSPEMAESIIARALGPYLDRQAKLQKYREVLNAELDRQSPLSDMTWAELRKLYQALGLAYEDVAPIDQEYIARIQAEVTRLQQQEEMTRLQEATRLQEEEVQREIEVQQDKADNYRQEFRTAIAKTLYPSEFDRGRLEQARRLWELDPDEVRAIEREVTDERYGPIESKSRLDYSRLRQLLWLNQWEPADQETERLILTALSHDMHPLDGNAILRLNCVDIQTIDALWALYSRRKFGFRAQQQVYLQRDNRADDFLVAVGWQDSVGLGNVNLLTRRKPYRDLQFSLDAPAGHLPTWRWAADTLEGAYVVDEEIVDTVFLHLEKCMPTPGLGTALGTPDGGTR
ncbi:MAG: GUN4 domain-containing protein [Leptolyngbya sp. SIO1E4]|nr:GUN4 domain-containing protein [Leptolyngbya sp. SIO1E4]